MLHLLILACVQQVAIHIVEIQIRRRPTIGHEKSDNLTEDGDEVDELEGYEDKEGSMVARTDARIEPWAMMVVPLHALAADVAVVAPWHRDYLAFVTELIDLKSL